jgi:tannase/feruloyl esterase
MSRKPRVAAILALLLLPVTITGGSQAASASPPPRGHACADLAASATRDREVTSATSAIVVATSTAPAYCQVRLVQKPAITVEVGLPLNSLDGGTGGATTGAWNGHVLNLGGGGYGGDVGSPAMAISRGDVGSSTDTGHSTAWCNAINPVTGFANAQPDCGLAGGGFVLDPTGKLLANQVNDFIKRSLYVQTTQALELTKTYYGRPALQNYWVGASTGGRQGWQMAQSYGDLFDGFLIGLPAINWNRFIIGEAWPAVVVNELLGSAGLPQVKSDAANAAAVAACDGLDGAVDGLIADQSRCHFNAEKLVCAGATTCLTRTEAEAVNLIWAGPRDAKGRQLWGGITRGTSFSTLLPGGTGMGALIDTYIRYWTYQDPTFDWRANLTIENFPKAFAYSQRKFAVTASTDSTDLSKVLKSGAKIIFYHGTNDPLITSYGSYNYVDRLTDRYGTKKLRSFVRTFFYPGLGHNNPTLAGGNGQTVMLDALENWVEDGPAPESFTDVAGSNGAIQVCAYPDRAVVTGTSGGKPAYACR